MNREVLFLIVLTLFILGSCEKDNIQLDYRAYSVPDLGDIRAINYINNQWVLAGGNKGSAGYILTADVSFENFKIFADSLEMPIYDQLFYNNRYIFSADKTNIYYADTGFQKINKYYPPEEYWVHTLNLKALWQILETPELGLYMACGGDYNKGIVYYLPNGENHWIPYELNNEIRSVGYQPPHTIWACGYGLLIKTHDFNSGWDIVDFKNKYFTGIEFLNEQVGLLATFDGEIYRTENGGNSWVEVSKIKGLSGGLSINKISFLNNHIAVAIGNGGYIAISYDAGFSWKTGSDFNGVNLNDMTFANGFLYLVGNKSEVYQLTL